MQKVAKINIERNWYILLQSEWEFNIIDCIVIMSLNQVDLVFDYPRSVS